MANAYDMLRSISGEKSRTISDRQLLDRFVADGDEAAFVDLVQRHARGVWGVCRRMLREQDAEDAFQAVFIVLARKAASIRKQEAVSSWLYGVAYRTALKARLLAAKRSTREQKASPPAAEPSPPSEAAWRELQRQLDEELQCLPEKYRAPFILCCLEGLNRTDAARELGWKEGTLSSRLAQAKKLLQSRLARRGVVLSAILTALALSQNSASACAPVSLVASAMLTTQCEATSAAALAESVIGAMGLAKAKAALSILVVATLLMGTTLFAGFVAFEQGEPEPKKVDAAVIETFVPPPIPVHKPIDESVLALALTLDGKKLVTAGAKHEDPGQIKVWDVASGAELARVRGNVGARSVAVSPNGKDFVTGHFGGTLVLRDLATAKEKLSAQPHSAGINGLAYSRDGSQIATAGLDRVIKILDAKTLKDVQELRGHTDMVFSVAFFRNSNAVVSGANDKTAIIWDLDAGEPKHVLKGHRASIETVAISPDDKFIATASWDKTVKIWDAQTGADKGTFVGSKGDLLAVAFSPDGDLLATGARDGTVGLWDVKTRALIRPLGRHIGAVWAVAFTRDGESVASCSTDKTAKLWHTSGVKEPVVFQSSEVRPVQALAYSPDGKELAVAGDDKLVRLFDPATGNMLLALHGHTNIVNAVAYLPDGQTIATGSADRTVKLWDRKSGTAKHTCIGHTGSVHAVAFAPGGKKIASAGDDKVVKIWDADGGGQHTSIGGHVAPIRALAFNAEGTTLASGGDDGTLQLSYMDQGAAPARQKAHEGSIRALAFAGTRLASAGEDGTIKLWTGAAGANWKPTAGAEPLMLKGQAGVLTIAFTHGGGSIVAGQRDGVITVWEVAAGQQRGSLTGHKGAVTALAVHPLGDNLVSGGFDAGLMRWRSATVKGDVTEVKPIAQAPDQPAPDGVDVPAGNPAPGAGRGKGWLIAALVIVFTLTLLVGAGAILYLRKIRQAAATANEQSPARLSVECPKCERKLKVKAALAGKKIKCLCGASVDVPKADAAAPE